MDHPCKHPGTMLEVEFAEVMDSLVSLVPDRLCRHLFIQGLASTGSSAEGEGEEAGPTKEMMPMKRLACILCILQEYLHGNKHARGVCCMSGCSLAATQLLDPTSGLPES